MRVLEPTLEADVTRAFEGGIVRRKLGRIELHGAADVIKLPTVGDEALFRLFVRASANEAGELAAPARSALETIVIVTGHEAFVLAQALGMKDVETRTVARDDVADGGRRADAGVEANLATDAGTERGGNKEYVS